MTKCELIAALATVPDDAAVLIYAADDLLLLDIARLDVCDKTERPDGPTFAVLMPAFENVT
jgi:hypothetical protein